MSAPCTHPLFLVIMVVVDYTFVTMVVINWTGYECMSDDEACIRVVPFLDKQLYTNDGYIGSCMSWICSLTPLVMPVGSGRQGPPKQQEAASATQARTKKRKGADSADESALKKIRLELEAPMKKKPGRPRKQALQEEALPEDIPVTTTQVRSKTFLLLSHLLTSGRSPETMVYFPVALPICIHLSAVCDRKLTKSCLSCQQCRLACLQHSGTALTTLHTDHQYTVTAVAAV